MKKYLTISVWMVALVLIACALLLFEKDLLWMVQEKNLFLYSTLFFKDQMVVAGGFLTWLGTWFTQFFYYPWLGVLLLCGWWLLLMFIVKRTFRIPDCWATLMLIPVALLLLANVDLGYWVYMLKLRGYFFVATIGTTAVAALLWGFRQVPAKHHLRTAYIILACLLGYPLLGIYGLAATLVMGIWTWRLSASRWEATIHSIVALLAIVAVPLFFYRYVYYQMNQANIYWAELPLFFITEQHHTYYIPYYLLLLFFILVAVTYRADRVVSKPIKGSVLYMIGQAVLVVALVGGVYHFWMKDENFHHELSMQHSIENLDWTGVLEEAAAQDDEPTRAIVMMRNLALSRLGKQGDQMFLYKNGSKCYDAPFGMRLMLVIGPMIYYQYGVLNYCNRLCMEMGVEFDFRPEYYKLMVRCAILENDQPLARKYINILKQTLFFHDWAEQAEKLLGHPDLIAKDPEMSPITHMLHYDNIIGGDQGYVERFLMRTLANSTYTKDPVFQEQALLATLWTKNIEQFWHHFYIYVRLHPKGPMPLYFQEAAYLYAKIEDRKGLHKIPFDKGVRDTYERFITSAMNYNNEDVEVVRQALYPFYGQTYYYDYYTMSQLPEY